MSKLHNNVQAALNPEGYKDECLGRPSVNSHSEPITVKHFSENFTATIKHMLND